MPNPVIHFEIVGKDGPKSQKFYADLFDWHVDANNPMDYGMVDTHAQGINGGITAGDRPTGTTIYVQVPDLQASLDKAESLGGKTVMPPTEIPGAVTMAMFTDPDGTVVGLILDQPQ